MQSTESTESGKDDLHTLFTRIVSGLCDKDRDLTFQPPFDLASSAALAANVDTGDIAQRLFDVTQRRETGFRVAVAAVAPDVQDRVIVDTTVDGLETLIVLLSGLIKEHLAFQH